MIVFAMLGAIMLASKVIMEALPNIHLLGMLVVTYTVVYRRRALIPIYIYVLLNGLYSGFSMWWVPYLYIWTILWGLTMLIPKGLPKRVRCVIYPIISSIHGFAYGILYAPAQAVMFGLDFNGMIAWIIAGFPFDLIHGVSNLIVGFLILPLSELLDRLDKSGPTFA